MHRSEAEMKRSNATGRNPAQQELQHASDFLWWVTCFMHQWP